MAEDVNVLSDEQRAFYENETGKKLPEGATWDSLDGEQKAVLSDVYAPKMAEAQDFANQYGEPEQEAAFVENKTPMSLEEALKAAAGKELYNLNPNELAEMNNVLRTAALDGNDDAVLGYGKVRFAMEEKMQAYANGEIETPIEWAGGMQAMLRAAKEKMPVKEPYKEEPVTGMHNVTAQNISNDESKDLSEMSLKDLAALKVEMDKNPEGFNKKRVDEAVGKRLYDIASMGKSDFIAKEDFAAAQALLDAIPMSNRRESAGKAFEIFSKVEKKLYDSRKVVNGTFDEKNLEQLAETCETKLKDFTETYDKDNGLWGLTSEDAERVSDNIASMADMGKDALDKEEYKEEPVKPMSHEEAEKAMAELKQGKDFDLKTLASLSASNAFGTVGPDLEVLDKAIADKLLKTGKKVPEDQLSSLDFLLEKASHMTENVFPGDKYQDIKNILNKNREDAQKNPKPKYPEMADAFALFSNLEITDGLSMTGKAKSKDNDELKAQLLESIRLQTMQSLAGTKPGPIEPEEFNKEFAANIVAEVGRLAGVEGAISGGTKEIEDYVKGHKIQVSKGALLGYQASQSSAREGFAARLESKVGKKNKGVEALRQHGKSLDENVAKNAPAKQYAMLKSLAKTAGWSGAYYVAGSTMGPAGVALVATASLANQALKLRKEYKKQKAEMAKKGKKLKLWSFLKDNKMALASATLTAMGVATAGLNAAEMAPEVVKALANAKATSGIALGAASTLKAFRDVRRSGGSVWKAMGAASIAGAATTWAVISGQTSHDASSPEISTSSETQVAEDVSVKMTDLDHDGIPDYIDRDGGQGWANDLDNDKVPDYIDRDGGQGWANEQPQEQAQTSENDTTSNVVEEPKREEVVLEPLDTEKAYVDVEQNTSGISPLHEEMAAHLEDAKVYGVQDPLSGKMVEFSLDENGEVRTHNAEQIKLIGSERLHSAMAERISQEAGNLSTRELAFLEKNMSQEQYGDVLLADAQIRAERDADMYAQQVASEMSGANQTLDAQNVSLEAKPNLETLNQDLQAQVHSGDGKATDILAQEAEKPNLSELNKDLQAQVHGTQAPDQTNEQATEPQQKELSSREKIAAVRQGKTVDEALVGRNSSITAQNVSKTPDMPRGFDPRGGGYSA